MRNRRDRQHPNTIVIHLTIRTAHGLPFVSRDYMNSLLLGIMAKAQELYPVQIVAFTWMANHPHFILAGRGNLISCFTNYLNGEVAQALQRLFPGVYPMGVWSSRTHEQTLCTPEDVLQKIAYLYANPARAHLVDSISEYQGLSSWTMFSTGSHRVEARWIPRRILSEVPESFSGAEERALLKDWKIKSPSTHFLTLSPYVWRKCFPESRSWDKEYIFDEILRRVQGYEAAARKERPESLPVVRNPHENSPRKDYQPQCKTTTPFVQCADPEMRSSYIERFKIFSERLRVAAQLLRVGKLKPARFAQFIPPGGFLPGGLLTSVLLFAVR